MSRWIPFVPSGQLLPTCAHDCRIFATPALRSGAPDRCVPLASPEDLDALTLFFAGSSLVTIASSQSLLPRPAPAPSSGLVTSARGAVFASRFMVPYFKLPKLPKRDLMSVYNSSAAWHWRLGPLDATAAAVIEGRLHMPKPRLTLRPSRRPNHASWERNEAAKIALGPKFAVWVWQGIVEMVPWNCPLPLFIEPLGLGRSRQSHSVVVAPHLGRPSFKRVPGRLGRMVFLGLAAGCAA